MATITYLDFDLRIERTANGYRTHVVNSPVGQASGEFTLPFSPLALENFLLRLGQTRNALLRDARLGESAEAQTPQIFGQRLFAAVFDNEVQACLRSSQDTVRRQGARLRLRLHLTDVPELATMPWEYLYHASLNRFLALSVETPLVRYLELPDLILPVAMTLPLRLLVMIASPIDQPQLDVEQEWGRLKAALADLERRGLLLIERVEDARLVVLQQRLRQRDYHILHFIGHGGFDAQRQEGVLLLEDQAARSHPVSGGDLGTLLHDHRSLRLVVLNACQGGQAAGNDPFAGVAQRLMQQRMPAVVAMQFAITDQAAITFAQEFYSALADNYPVDAALTEARKAIFAQGNKIEWGTPVLYMRAPDGRIFDLKALPPTTADQSSQPPMVVRQAHPLPDAPMALVSQTKVPLKTARNGWGSLRNWPVWLVAFVVVLAVWLGMRQLSSPAAPVVATGVAPTTIPVPVTVTTTIAAPRSSQPICTLMRDLSLASIYSQTELGCATDKGRLVWAAWQPFERGSMLWRLDNDQIYVIYNGNSWVPFYEHWENQALPSRGTPPVGLQAPMNGFGYAWGVNNDLFTSLGWAKDEEKGFCAFIQSFEHGFILRSSSIEFCQDQLYNHARARTWAEILLAVTDDGRWWKS